MNTWEDILYDAKKSFYQKSRISPEHIELRKALDVVEKEIKPLSRELDEKRKEIDQLKAFSSDAATQLRLAEYEKDKEIERIKLEMSRMITGRLKEKDLFYASQINEYELRIKDLKGSLITAQDISEKLLKQKKEAENSLSANMQKVFENERSEHTLIVKRKDDDLMNMQGRLIRKEEEFKSLNDSIREAESSKLISQKQWLKEIFFSRELLKKTFDEMDIMQKDHVQHESVLIQDFQKQMLQYRKHVSYLEKELPEQRFSILQSEISEKQSIVKEQEEEISKLRAALEETKKLSIYKNESEQSSKKNLLLKDKIKSLDDLLKTSRDESAAVTEKHAQLAQEFSIYRQKDDGIAQDFEMLRKTGESLRSEKLQLEQALQKEKEVFANRLEKYEKTIANLKNKLHLQEHTAQSPEQTLDESHAAHIPGHFNFIPRLPDYEAPRDSSKDIAQDSDTFTIKPPAMKRSARIGISLAVIGSLILALYWGRSYYGSFSSPVLEKTIDPSFSPPGNNPSALIWDGLTFWSTDWYAKKIFKHRSQHISEVDSNIQLSGIIPTAITWAEGSMWVCDTWSKKIYSLNLDNGQTIKAAYASPGNKPSGLTWDGTYLWSCDAAARKIYRHKTDESLSITQTFISPGTSPSGLLYDGDSLWSSDSDTGMIYRHRMDKNLSVIASYQPRDYADNNDKLIGLTWDGKYFWTVGERSGKFYRHSLTDMIKSKS